MLFLCREHIIKRKWRYKHNKDIPFATFVGEHVAHSNDTRGTHWTHEIDTLSHSSHSLTHTRFRPLAFQQQRLSARNTCPFFCLIHLESPRPLLFSTLLFSSSPPLLLSAHYSSRAPRACHSCKMPDRVSTTVCERENRKVSNYIVLFVSLYPITLEIKRVFYVSLLP